MKFSKIILSMTAGAALVAGTAGRSSAWQQPVGGPTPIATCTKQGPSNLFTLNTNEYQTVISGATVYTYRFDLTNNSDASGLSALAVDASGSSAADYFIGFGPDSTGTGLHDSNIGYTTAAAASSVGSPSSYDAKVSAGQDADNAHPYTWSAAAANGIVTFSAASTGNNLTTGHDLTGSNQGKAQTEYFFVQSLNELGSINVTVSDGAKNSYALTTCNLQSKGTQAAPEPAALLPFAFGGLGLLGLTVRARRGRAAA